MNLQSKELFINMKESDIPVWNELYSFDEQEDDVKQFWENEADKLANGVNINGVYIHPWLYWHINFWKMMLDVKDDSSPTGFVRVPGNTMLRDCEWLFTEFLQKAEEENKGIFMFGTRRFGKALLNSELLYMEDGEKRIGDVIVGDKIYDDSGKLTEVIGVYPQGRVTTYKVTFEDGRNVICCGDHIWKVWHMNGWRIKPLKSIMGLEYDKMSIPLCEGVEYPKAKLPINPSTYGAMVASWLAGSEPEIFFDSNLCRKFLRASLEQKEMFINSFIKFFKGVVTNDDVIPVTYVDYDVIRFVQRIFWSFGWYAMFNGSELHVSGIKRKLKISSIEIYGKENATCITVDNTSRLFLTTNYIVTHNTAIMSSFLGRNATMTYNLTHNVIGSSKEDLASMAEYLEFGLDNLPSYLRINRTGNDWSKEVILGTKSLNNIRDVHARVRIMNIDSGKVGASLKTAGGTPYTSIYDEVGKFPVLGAYLAGKPAHMMHGKMRGMIILSGTGGNVEKSQDAQKIMNSPSDYGFIVMDYDLLNKRTTKPTWRICQSGCFVPAQMSHSYPKVETTLDKYLNVDKAPGLKKIKIQVSDFDKNTDVIKEKLDELVTKDRSLFVQQKMAYPLTIDDCFLNQNVNRFPVEDALIHKNRILEEGRTGKLVDIYQVDGKRMGWSFSEKQLAPYPFKGGNIECPVVLYEDPPEEGGNFDYTYVSGLDPYKQDKANTESLGSFYILKRHVKINDPFAYKIVASYVSRPGISDDFCRTVEILIEAYGAKCLMENADRMFETYLSRRNKELVLLEDGEKLANKIIRTGSRQNNKLGLSPTVPNQRMLFNTVIQYCWEEVVVGYDDDGNEITQKGIYRIDDIELLDEIIAFGPNVNTDRIIAFGHALLLAKYYDDMGFMPESTTQKMNREKREERKKYQMGGFTLRRRNPFTSLRKR